MNCYITAYISELSCVLKSLVGGGFPNRSQVAHSSMFVTQVLFKLESIWQL